MLVKDQFKRITWDEIFGYHITAEGISKPSELREVKTFFNHAPSSASKPTTSQSEKSVGPSGISSFSVDKKSGSEGLPLTTSSNGIFRKKLNK